MNTSAFPGQTLQPVPPNPGPVSDDEYSLLQKICQLLYNLSQGGGGGGGLPENPLAIVHGGTGATDAATARTNLGAGDVVGPASATDGELALFDGPTGKLIKGGGSPGIIGNYAPRWTYTAAGGAPAAGLFTTDNASMAASVNFVLSKSVVGSFSDKFVLMPFGSSLNFAYNTASGPGVASFAVASVTDDGSNNPHFLLGNPNVSGFGTNWADVVGPVAVTFVPASTPAVPTFFQFTWEAGSGAPVANHFRAANADPSTGGQFFIDNAALNCSSGAIQTFLSALLPGTWMVLVSPLGNTSLLSVTSSTAGIGFTTIVTSAIAADSTAFATGDYQIGFMSNGVGMSVDTGWAPPESVGNRSLNLFNYAAVDFSGLDAGAFTAAFPQVSAALNALSTQVNLITNKDQALETALANKLLPNA